MIKAKKQRAARWRRGGGSTSRQNTPTRYTAKDEHESVEVIIIRGVISAPDLRRCGFAACPPRQGPASDEGYPVLSISPAGRVQPQQTRPPPARAWRTVCHCLLDPPSHCCCHARRWRRAEPRQEPWPPPHPTLLLDPRRALAPQLQAALESRLTPLMKLPRPTLQQQGAKRRPPRQ